MLLLLLLSGLLFCSRLLLLLLLLFRILLRFLLNEAVEGSLDGVQALVDGFRLLGQLKLTLELLQSLLLRVQDLGQTEGAGRRQVQDGRGALHAYPGGRGLGHGAHSGDGVVGVTDSAADGNAGRFGRDLECLGHRSRARVNIREFWRLGSGHDRRQTN